MSDQDAIQIHVGSEELEVRQRYELASIGNDILIGLWFVVGSILFFWESTATVGTWFFLIGSAELLLRPAIRLKRRFHLRRYHGAKVDSGAEY